MKKQPQKNPHDRFVKAALDDARLVLDFFDAFVPDKLKQRVRLNEFERIKETFVDRDLRERFTDVLFKVPLAGKKSGSAYLYFLVEHQRRSERLTAFRDWGYKYRIADFHMKQTGVQEIPFVHTFVIYNGKEPYAAPTSPVELVDLPEEIARDMFTGYQLIDVSHIPDDVLKKRLWTGVFLMMLKHIDDPDAVEILMRLAYHLKRIAKDATGLEFLAVVFKYLFGAGQTKNPELIAEVIRSNISEEAGRQMTTIAQMYKEKGKAEGKAEGIREATEGVASRLLASGCDLAFVSQITGIPADELQNLRKRSKE